VSIRKGEVLPTGTKVFISDVHLFGDLKRRTGVVTAYNVDLGAERRTGKDCVNYLVVFDDFGDHWISAGQIEGYLHTA